MGRGRALSVGCRRAGPERSEQRGEERVQRGAGLRRAGVLGRAREQAREERERRRRRAGPDAGEGGKEELGWFGFLLLSYFLFQTKLNLFEFKFEFKPHSIK